MAALGALGTPVTGLVTGEAEPGHEDLVEIVAPSTASVRTRLGAIRSAIKRHSDVDIVDAHFALTALPALFGRVGRRPLVVHFQGPWADESALAGESWLACKIKRRVERLVYSRADAIVVLSKAFRRVLMERYGVSPWNIHVIPPGVDTERFSPGEKSEARAVLGLPVKAFVAVTVRRLVPRMGLDVLLEAWAELVDTNENPVVLCIVGAGPQRDELEAQCAELDLGGVVRFVGRIDDTELVRYYQAADVSIVPSVALEGFGLVVLESLASGTPVVASGLDGLAEALEGLAPDLLVPPGDPEALAERLRGALTGVQPLPTAEACRRYAEGFSWAEVARHHRKLYRQLAGTTPKQEIVEQEELRVVILDHTAQLSGGELAIHRVASALRGVRVHAILAQDGPLVDLLERDGVSVQILPMEERARDLRKDRVRWSKLPIGASAQSAVYVLRLADRIARLRPDIVHTNTLKSALYGGLAARLARVPCVWHIRDRIAPDYLPPSAIRLVRLRVRLLPDAVIVNSRTTLDTLPIRKTRSNASRLRCGGGQPAQLAFGSPRSPESSHRSRDDATRPARVPGRTSESAWSDDSLLGRVKTCSSGPLQRPFRTVSKWRSWSGQLCLERMTSNVSSTKSSLNSGSRNVSSSAAFVQTSSLNWHELMCLFMPRSSLSHSDRCARRHGRRVARRGCRRRWTFRDSRRRRDRAFSILRGMSKHWPLASQACR